jgi:hypothetical protein
VGHPADIQAIELFGGGVRVPKLKEAIAERYPKIPVGVHVDGDEAALLGAYHASVAFATGRECSVTGRLSGAGMYLASLNKLKGLPMWFINSDLKVEQVGTAPRRAPPCLLRLESHCSRPHAPAPDSQPPLCRRACANRSRPP